MINVRALSKRYGYRLALSQVDLQAKPGEIVALLGPNGAGKSTLLRLLATLARPTGGSIELGGYRLADQAIEARSIIGYLGHKPLLYEDLSAEQNLAFFARLYDLPNAGARVTKLLNILDLADRRRDPLRAFSRGMQQRVALARALLHKPRILLLDEPHSALDLQSAAALDKMLRAEAKSGVVVVFASHDLTHAASLATRVEMMAEGRIVSSLRRSQFAGGLATQYVRAQRSQRGD